MPKETVTLADGTDVDADAAVFVAAHDCHYLLSDCVELADGEWMPRSESTLCHDGCWYVTDDCVELVSGEWAHEEDEEIVGLANGDYCCTDDARRVGSDWHHADDVSCCDSCGDNFLSEDCYATPSGTDYCEECYGEHVCCCDSCGDDIWRDDSCSDEDGDGTYCDSCVPESSRSDLVLDYSDKSSIDLPSDTPRSLRLLGIELEVECRGKRTQHDGATFAREHLPDDYCVFKEDGSLGSNGFEIVTRWDSAAVHVEHFKQFFAAEPHKVLKSWDAGCCGMHVHVAKSSLSHLQIGKMMCFVNADENKSMVVHVAGRTSGYATISPKKVSDARKPDYRRSSLNVTHFSAEFRIFKGTLKPAGFYRNLEFVQAVVRFCEPAARSITEATSAAEFCRWLPKADYPHLHAHLVRGGFIVGVPTPEATGDA